jgi:hypothetical protein
MREGQANRLGETRDWRAAARSGPGVSAEAGAAFRLEAPGAERSGVRRSAIVACTAAEKVRNRDPFGSRKGVEIAPFRGNSRGSHRATVAGKVEPLPLSHLREGQSHRLGKQVASAQSSALPCDSVARSVSPSGEFFPFKHLHWLTMPPRALRALPCSRFRSHLERREDSELLLDRLSHHAREPPSPRPRARSAGLRSGAPPRSGARLIRPRPLASGTRTRDRAPASAPCHESRPRTDPAALRERLVETPVIEILRVLHPASTVI